VKQMVVSNQSDCQAQKKRLSKIYLFTLNKPIKEKIVDLVIILICALVNVPFMINGSLFNAACFGFCFGLAVAREDKPTSQLTT